MDKQDQGLEYSVINSNNKPLEAEAIENNIANQVQKHSYFSQAPVQEEMVRKIVKETVQEQLPFIIAQVRETILKELRVAQPVIQQQAAVPNLMEEKPRAVPMNEPEQDYEEIKINENPVYYEGQYLPSKPEKQSESVMQKLERNPIFGQVKKFGNALKEQIVELPGKAKDVLDDWSQKIEGDPFITCAEGRYPKSVVDKAMSLLEIFPEENKKTLLDFVQKYPRYVTLEQLANLWIYKDQPQEAENLNNADANANANANDNNNNVVAGQNNAVNPNNN